MTLTNEIVIEKAKALGFELVGFAQADQLNEEILKLEKWIGRGYQAGMKYMEKNIDKRKDVKNILPEAKSVISLAINYYTNAQFSNKKGNGKISRYAWGKDYHIVIWALLDKLESELKEIDPSFESKSYVDTGPVMDKSWAVKAGIGWLGKHTNVINKEIGSWIFLSTLITNYQFNYSNPVPDFCGSCTACIDACPTDAIVEEYVVDSNKCISYLTIENKVGIDQTFKNKFEGWLFGCDICQDVCPWNIRFSEASTIPAFRVNNSNREISIHEVLNMNKEEFLRKFEDSPIRRAKLKGLKRNADFIKY